MDGTTRLTECVHCGNSLVASWFSEYVMTTGVVLHHWRCAKCDCEFETSFNCALDHSPILTKNQRLDCLPVS
jgi:hypothetical protein